MIYRGKDERRPNDIESTRFPVWQLLRNPRYHMKNHVLYVDNWYNSVSVCVMCGEGGIYVIGTVRMNRRGIPAAEHRFQKTGSGKKARGTVEMMMQTQPNGSHLYFVAWMDSKPVRFLSTLPAKITKVNRNESMDDTFQRREIDYPTIVGLYNAGMGGTDLIDQRISYFAHRVKTLKWQQKVYTHFLNISVANA